MLRVRGMGRLAAAWGSVVLAGLCSCGGGSSTGATGDAGTDGPNSHASCGAKPPGKACTSVFSLTPTGAFTVMPTQAGMPLQPILNATAAVDLNSDGKADLVTLDDEGSGSATDTDQVLVALSSGGGSFASPTRYSLFPERWTGYSSVLAVGDVDGDCAPDIVVYGSRLVWFLNNGDGTFRGGGSVSVNQPAYSTPLPPFQVPTYGENLALADMNGDGKADVVLGSSTHVGVSLSSGSTQFAAGGDVDYPMPAGVSQVSVVAVADFDGDHVPDVAMSDGSTSTIAIFLNDGRGAIAPGVVTKLPASASGVGLAAADFDHDGKADVAVDGLAVDGLTVMMGRGDGTFGVPVGYKLGMDNINASASIVMTADFNADGYADLAIDDRLQHAFVLLNKGDGTFAAGVPFSTKDTQSLAAGDWLGSGLLGVLVSSDSNQVQTFAPSCR